MNKIREFVHLIYIPFRDVGVYDRFRDDKWFAERIEIFKQYTLKSLLNQENRNFILWISFRPKERNSFLVKELKLYLKSLRMKYIFTYDGLMYWDDKFSGSLWSRLLNCARVARFCLRNRNLNNILPQLFEILFYDKNASLEQRLDKSLRIIENEFRDVDFVYMTRLDSDDMIYKSYIKEIQNQPLQGQKSFVFNKGFIYNGEELAEYNPKTNPPFYTILFPSNIFFNTKEHLDYYKDFKSHEDIPRVFNPFLLMPDYRYCVVTHNSKAQISTIFNHPFRGKLIENKYEILKDFGL